MFEINIQHIRNSLVLFTKEITKEYYLYVSSRKPVLNLDGIYSRYSYLFTQEVLEYVKLKLNKEILETDEKKKLKYLIEALYAEVFGNKVKYIRENLSVLESTGEIKLAGGQRMSYFSSISDLYNNTSRNKREQIREARCRYTEKFLNPLLAGEFEAERSFIKSLGYSDKIQMFKDLSGIDLYILNEQVINVLENTEPVYLQLLTDYSKKSISTDVKELCLHDIYFMMGGHEFDEIFLPDKLLSTASAFCDGMGFDLKANGKINIDAARRETKSRRAFCAPVSVPNEIYLVLNPYGGVSDYSAFFHEMGHALHFANMPDDMDFEFKILGDSSVSEGFAMLFDHLLTDVKWLKTYTSINSSVLSQYLEYCMLKELLLLRRFAAKLDYEINLNKNGDLSDKREMYSKTFKNITKINYNEEDFLTDVEPNFYCARYLRGWMFQSEVKKYLLNNFGEKWFINKNAGIFIAEIWSLGQKYTADELLKIKNCGYLSVSSLLENIEIRLNKS